MLHLKFPGSLGTQKSHFLLLYGWAFAGGKILLEVNLIFYPLLKLPILVNKPQIEREEQTLLSFTEKCGRKAKHSSKRSLTQIVKELIGSLIYKMKQSQIFI